MAKVNKPNPKSPGASTGPSASTGPKNPKFNNEDIEKLNAAMDAALGSAFSTAYTSEAGMTAIKEAQEFGLKHEPNFEQIAVTDLCGFVPASHKPCLEGDWSFLSDSARIAAGSLENLEELKASIKGAGGIISTLAPSVVRVPAKEPKGAFWNVLINGHRRIEALRQLIEEEAPVSDFVWVDVYSSEEKVAIEALKAAANVAPKEASAVEKFSLYIGFKAAGWTDVQIAERLGYAVNKEGRPSGAYFNLARISRVDPEIQRAFLESRISLKAANDYATIQLQLGPEAGPKAALEAMASGIRRNDALKKGRDAARERSEGGSEGGSEGDKREARPSDGLFHPLFKGQKMVGKVYKQFPKDSPLRLPLSVMGGMTDIPPAELAGRLQTALKGGSAGLGKALTVLAWTFGFRAPKGMEGFGMAELDDLLKLLDSAAAK